MSIQPERNVIPYLHVVTLSITQSVCIAYIVDPRYTLDNTQWIKLNSNKIWQAIYLVPISDTNTVYFEGERVELQKQL